MPLRGIIMPVPRIGRTLWVDSSLASRVVTDAPVPTFTSVGQGTVTLHRIFPTIADALKARQPGDDICVLSGHIEPLPLMAMLALKRPDMMFILGSKVG